MNTEMSGVTRVRKTDISWKCPCQEMVLKTARLAVRSVVGLCLVVLAAGGAHGEVGEIAETSDAWRNLRGTHECFPFRIEDGKGFQYDGENYDDPSTPIVSRPDWVVSKAGRTFVLYDVDPGDLSPNGFYKQYHESLWIGLVDGEGTVVRKIKLATGVKDISGVKEEGGGELFVSATGVSGEETNIVLRFPEPWPSLEPTGDAWKDFELRQQRKWDELEEDWPGNGSGMAADWMSLRMEEWMRGEYERVLTAVEDMARDEAEARQVREGPAAAFALLEEKNAHEDEEPGNVHWGNTMSRVDREQYLKPFFQNWMEAIQHPDGWETVKNARVLFEEETLQANNGIVVLGVPKWIRKEEGASGYHRLLRLSPARVREEEGRIIVGFDVIDPWVMDSGWLAGKGELVLKNGEMGVCWVEAR